MAKFSGFNLQTAPLADNLFFVGYENGGTNFQALVSDLYPVVGDTSGSTGISLIGGATDKFTIELHTLLGLSDKISLTQSVPEGTIGFDVDESYIDPALLGSDPSIITFLPFSIGGLDRVVPSYSVPNSGMLMHLSTPNAYGWVQIGNNLSLREDTGTWYLDASPGAGRNLTEGPGIVDFSVSDIIQVDFGNSPSQVAEGSNVFNFNANAAGLVSFNVTGNTSALVGSANNTINFDLDITDQVTNQIWNTDLFFQVATLLDGIDQGTITAGSVLSGGGVLNLHYVNKTTLPGEVVPLMTLSVTPASNNVTVTINDAPSDGNKYVRQSGAWVLAV